MNAKKIMGAVLVALLAAALFVGAGAAAEEEAAGTVFLYQSDIGSIVPGIYSYNGVDVEVKDGTYKGIYPLNLEKFVDGAKYSNGTAYITVKLPNAGFTAVGNPDATPYDAMANGLIAKQKVVFTATPTVSTFTGSAVEAIIIYNEAGEPTRYDASPEFVNGVLTLGGLDKGTYQIQAVLAKSGNFVNTVEGSQLYGQKYSFTVYSTEPEITASADTVLIGNFITVTITGKPGDSYYLDAEGFTIPEKNQVVATGSGNAIYVQADISEAIITLPNSGKITVYLKASDDTGKQTILLKAYDATNGVGAKKASANVKIEKGAITAFADEDSFFVGNPIGLHGTTTAGSDLFFYIEGTNFKFTQIDIIPNVWAENGELEVVNGEWTAKFDSTAIKSLDDKKLVAGTYTIVVSTLNATSPDAAVVKAIAEAGSVKDAVMSAVSGTAAVTMTQPFLTGIEAAAVAIQETDYDITGIAYSAEEVRIYIFGTNFFVAAQADVDADDETFEYTLKKGVTKDMAPGTYFYLIQHPMGDKLFNVWNGTGFGTAVAGTYPTDFFYAATSTDLRTGAAQINDDDVSFIFNAYERGTNYAAQALLNEISGQNIDDIFVQGTFEVEAQKLTINPIPAEVVKGTALTVSGTTNSGEGVEVIVNVLAGTFGATVKGDENAATFLTAKAVTEEDGTFAAAIDTSKLEAGNYIVTVELNGQMYDSAAVEIVEKAPETPVDPVDPVDPKPVDPVTPTEPETPGFGALAALAGLGAVAVLLLRRE